MHLHLYTAGEGPRLLLIQGTGIAGCAWSPQVEVLKEHFTVAWYDAPGMGGRPGALSSIEAMADDARAMLDALGWERAFVAGHSLGGLISLKLALTAPERVAGLLLLCTLARGSAAFSFSPAMLWLQTRTLLGTTAMRRRAFFTLVSDPRLAPDEENIAAIEAVFQRPIHQLPSAAFAQLRGLAGVDLTPSLASVACPAAVLAGRQDQIAPAEQGRVLAAGLDCPLELVDGGHALPIQEAARVSAWMRTHLQSWL